MKKRQSFASSAERLDVLPPPGIYTFFRSESNSAERSITLARHPVLWGQTSSPTSSVTSILSLPGCLFTITLPLTQMDDPTRKTIESAVHNGHVFSIPWAPNPFRIHNVLSAFESSLASTGDPFSRESPFKQDITRFILDCSGKTSGSGFFKETTTTGSSSSSDHMSVGAGITIGCCFLEASVSGRYDRLVVCNKDVCVIDCDCGCVLKMRTYRITNEASGVTGEGP